MLLLAFLACPGPGPLQSSEITLRDVSLSVGTDLAHVGPDSTLHLNADLVEIERGLGEPRVTLLSDGPFVPVVVDAQGQRIPLIAAPDTTLAEAYVDHQAPPERWAAAGGLEPGDYSVSTIEDLDGAAYTLPEVFRFEVRPTAQGPNILQAGDTFLVNDYHLHDLAGLLQNYGSSWIRVAEVDGDRARMELIIESASRCVAVNTWTDWSGDGVAWSQDSLSIEAEGQTLTGHGIFTALPLSTDGQELLGGQATMVVDMSSVDRLLAADSDDWELGDSCGLLAGFGIQCGTCLVGAPEQECLALSLTDLHALRLSEEEAAALGTELPSCGIDLADIEAPVIDLSGLENLNFDCGCTTAAGFSSMSLGWLALALVRTRRRKKGQADRPPSQAG